MTPKISAVHAVRCPIRGCCSRTRSKRHKHARKKSELTLPRVLEKLDSHRRGAFASRGQHRRTFHAPQGHREETSWNSLVGARTEGLLRNGCAFAWTDPLFRLGSGANRYPRELVVPSQFSHPIFDSCGGVKLKSRKIRREQVFRTSPENNIFSHTNHPSEVHASKKTSFCQDI